MGRDARQGKTTLRNCGISRRQAALNIATRVMHHLPNIKSIGMIYRCFHVKLYFIETILGRSEVGLLDAQNEVDQSGDIAHVHRAVAVNVGTSIILWNHTQYHVDEGGHIAHIHGAITVHITTLS